MKITMKEFCNNVTKYVKGGEDIVITKYGKSFLRLTQDERRGKQKGGLLTLGEDGKPLVAGKDDNVITNKEIVLKYNCGCKKKDSKLCTTHGGF